MFEKSNIEDEKSNIEEKLTKIIAGIKKIPVSDIELSDDDDFITKYNLDSLDSVSLTMEISSKFNVMFGTEVEDIDSLSSFGALVQLIEKRTAA